MPHITRYWCPFTDTTNEELVHAREKYQGKQGCRVLNRLTPHSLAFMYPEETLIINGHGSSGSLVLSETSNGTGRSIAMQALANALEEAGLPENHVRIRLLGCETADMARFMAIQLGRTHPRIVVGGYRYTIFVGAGHRTLVWGPENNYPAENTTGSGNVVWYNAMGQPVSKPGGKLDQRMYDPYLDTV